MSKQFPVSLLSAAVVFLVACDKEAPADVDGASHDVAAQEVVSVLPASDPDNTGGWVLREDISDEFDGTEIDRSKWFVQGENGDYYIWKGRAPSQFAPHNVIVEDGLLKIRSQWEPEFNFAVGEGHEGNDYAYHEGEFIPVTTAGIITHKRFLNGYMEVRSKAVDAAMTSAFWMIGYESELDVYEQMGNPKIDSGSGITATAMKASVHDWRPPGERPTRKFGYEREFPYRIADDFHVYGVDWGPDYLKFYIDGEHVHTVTQEEVGRYWVLTNPLEVWLDSEIFVWLGLPHAEELPADFEVDYMRVWQKPESNLLDRAFFGFEGPFLYQDHPRPLDLEPPSSEENDYQKFWRIDDASAERLSVVRHETHASGTRSLKFTPAGGIAQAVSPESTVSLPAGDLLLSAKVFIEEEADAESLSLSILAEDERSETFDLTALPKGEWATLTQAFSLEQALDGQLKIAFEGNGDTVAAVYLDDISIEKGN